MGFQEDWNELKELDEFFGINRYFVADALVDDEVDLVMVVNAAKKVSGEDAQTYKIILANAIIHAFTAHMESELEYMRQRYEDETEGCLSRAQEEADMRRDTEKDR